MSDILNQIDDTLADWHGSADSMRWTPGDVSEPARFTAPEAGWYQVGLGLQSMLNFTRATFALTTSTAPPRDEIDEETASFLQLVNPWSLEMTLPLAEPTMGQGYWQIQAARRPIAAAFQVSLAELGIAPRYGFDARYHQRQRNRRKRRR